MINLDCDSIDSKKFVDIIERGNEKTEKQKKKKKWNHRDEC